MKWSTLMLAALLLLIFIGCNESVTQDTTLTDLKQEEKNYETDTIGQKSPGSEREKNEQDPGENKTVSNPDWDKKIIKTATLQVEVKDYSKYHPLLYSSVKRVGGYVAQEDQAQSEHRIENIVVIKIPVEQFDEAVNLLINGTGQDKLIEKKIASEDVTGQVIDTKSRLEAKRQVRIRYLELLKQAKNMEEILQVQNEINDLQEHIEMAAGRVAFLNRSAAYSTINLRFFQILNPSASNDNRPSFFVKMARAFEYGWDLIKQLLLDLISIWPLLVVLAGVWIGFRKWKSSKVKTS